MSNHRYTPEFLAEVDKALGVTPEDLGTGTVGMRPAAPPSSGRGLAIMVVPGLVALVTALAGIVGLGVLSLTSASLDVTGALVVSLSAGLFASVMSGIIVMLLARSHIDALRRGG